MDRPRSIGPQHEYRGAVTMLSRRDLCLATAPLAAGMAGAALAKPRPAVPSARDVVAALAGLATIDLIAGQTEAPVTGVAFVTDPSLANLRKAQAAGCSLILSPETPFYGKPADPASVSGPFAAMAQSAATALRESPALRAKQALIEDGKLAVYRLTSQALRAGDTSVEALAARLGWTQYRVAGAYPIYRPPVLTLAGLLALAKARLGARGGLRFIGDPGMRLSSVLLVPGTAEVISTTQGLRHADALLTGDVREWELVEYVHDSAEAGLPKALVATGRILSEQPFLERCALAVGHAFPDLPLRSLMSSDPFWRVQA